MASVKVEVVLAHLSGLAKDAVVNDFAFTTPSTPPTGAELTAISTALVSFYNTVPSGHNSIANIIGPTISRVALVHQIRFYDITGHEDGSRAGSPVRVDTWTLNAMTAGAAPLPTECAIALSFHSPFFSDPEFGIGTRPRSRDRGRIYIGPLVQGTLDHNPPVNRPFVAQSTRETLVTQGAALRDDTGTAWCVWSRKSAALKTISNVSVDDAFDTQRRRGEVAGVVLSNP